jgi:aconitase B
MGDTAHKFVTGLSADTITVSFLNDTAAANVLATLQAAYGTTVAFVAIQDSSAAVSATNVLYSGTILVDNLTDINGAVADEGMLDLTFTCNSKTAIATTGTWS